jgi:hypothetical protein
MNNKLTKSARMLGLVLGLAAGPAVPSYAYVMNSFDSLTGLTAGTNSSIAIDNTNYYQGTGSVLLSWSGGTGYFDWTLPTVTNFTGETTSLAAYDSSNITRIGFELIDSSGLVAESWYWNVQPSQYNIWTPLTITQGSASGASVYTIGPGDITQIAYARFHDDGHGNNYWDTTPEPGTVLLLGTGLALLSVKQRKMLA